MARRKPAALPPLPPLPATVHSQLGPVPIVLVLDLKATNGDELFGLWCPDERTIKLRANIHVLTQWATLKHEAVHCWLWDAGVNLPEELEERVADALSSALVAEMIRGLRLP